MDLVVHQNIVIHQFRVNNVTNSSVVQIGSAGLIKPLSNLYNTGCFEEAAGQLGESGQVRFLVPLPSPT
ncbi:spore germination protein GerPB [Paenibacillus xerothermodurans]|uniref:Spore gernimation protein n=1 Tax=Paenibacillus xerothermodurans TaxID=1977292 RepID=A0A2W1NFA0_PAEXE|nr:spore germination protein GerPB [Paenibacillus xerothermodurans]PZE22370.1 spore gernimation protein [Paenibacillus xerothermodurans]